MRPLLLLTAVFVLLPLAARADVYRWVDAGGEVHYSDRPREGAELVRMTSPRPPSPADEAPRRVASTPDATAAVDEQASREAARAVAQDLAAKRAADCTDAKARYDKSLKARRIFRTLENGEREYLSDAEADQVRVANRAAMDAACGPSTASR